MFNELENIEKLDEVSASVIDVSLDTGKKKSQNNLPSINTHETLNPNVKVCSSQYMSEDINNKRKTSRSRKSLKKVKICYKCIYDDCNFASYSDAETSLHIEQHRPKCKINECIDCKLKFLKKESFIRHSNYHLKDSKRIVACKFPGCSKKYTTIYNRDVNIF